jgi:hypothetical protein
MSKVYRCIDCLKEFRFDYSDLNIENFDYINLDSEENIKLIKQYNRTADLPMEINICPECLESMNRNKNTCLESSRNINDNLKKQCEDRINELKNQKEDESLFKDFTEEKEEMMKQKLEQIKKEVNENENKLQKLLSGLDEVQKDELKFWEEYKNLEKDIYKVEKNLSKSNDVNLDYQNKIKNFAGSNIFTDLFEIVINDKYGVINGCAFNEPLNSSHFDNINAGWGYIVFLTKLISVKYNMDLPKYDLVPLGNYSIIKSKNNEREQFELFLTDKSNSKGNFNIAMVKYLEYLNSLLTYLSTQFIFDKKSMDICPKIVEDKINDISIKIDNDYLDNWYQCMKNLLIILKFLISQILSQENRAYKGTIDTVELINLSDINEIKENNNK